MSACTWLEIGWLTQEAVKDMTVYESAAASTWAVTVAARCLGRVFHLPPPNAPSTLSVSVRHPSLMQPSISCLFLALMLDRFHLFARRSSQHIGQQDHTRRTSTRDEGLTRWHEESRKSCHLNPGRQHRSEWHKMVPQSLHANNSHRKLSSPKPTHSTNLPRQLSTVLLPIPRP
jgi:hypothetical protein